MNCNDANDKGTYYNDIRYENKDDYRHETLNNCDILRCRTQRNGCEKLFWGLAI